MIRNILQLTIRDFLPSKQVGVRMMLILLFYFGVGQHVIGQNISGQWIGKFTSQEDPEGGGTDYVLEIESSGTQLSGYSYTYFSIAGKRYFVICRLKGNYDKSSKSLVISEVETVKTNTPPDFENCHQTHQLTYLKQKDKETLVGKWKPTEKGSTCGKGFTELERKALVKENNTKPSSSTKNVQIKPSGTQPTSSAKPKSSTPPPPGVVKTTPPVTKSTAPNKAAAIQKPPVKTAPTTTTPPIAATENTTPIAPPKGTQQTVKDNSGDKKSDKSALPAETAKAKNIPDNTKDKLSKRTYQVIKVIEVTQPQIKVDIYDNGQVDGDVVSIFLNEKQLISSTMLTAQPITLHLKVDDQEEVYDLIMYAESLGSIPPNTALMIITTPTQRYEINISSNEQTSGAIRFKFKK